MSFALFEDGTIDVCRPQVPHAVNMIGRLRRPCCDWFLPTKLWPNLSMRPYVSRNSLLRRIKILFLFHFPTFPNKNHPFPTYTSAFSVLTNPPPLRVADHGLLSVRAPKGGRGSTELRALFPPFLWIQKRRGKMSATEVCRHLPAPERMRTVAYSRRPPRYIIT